MRGKLSSRRHLLVLTVVATFMVATGLTVTPADATTTTPGPPTGVVAKPEVGSATVTWFAPASNGGSPIIKYVATASPGSKSCTTKGTICSVPDLTNGVTYTVTVRARNANGLGAASAAVEVKPGVPQAPSSVNVAAGDGEVTIRWVAPKNNGHSITRYKVTSEPGSKTCSATGGAMCSVLGLADGTAYKFSVTATNAIGTGPRSAYSEMVTPIPSQTLDVDGDPFGISSDGDHVWVAELLPSIVEELDTTSGSVVGQTTVGLNPGAISSDGTDVWVANNGDDTVTELDASDGSVVQTIPVGHIPDGISSDGTHVWVSNGGGSSVTELNASDGDVVDTIALGSQPAGISSDGTHVWVADGTSNSVTELNTSDGSTVRTIPVGSDPVGISSDGTHVWVANVGSDTVTELNASNGSVVRTIGAPVKGAMGVAISSNGTDVWVVNLGGLPDTVAEISAANGAIVNRVAVGDDPLAVSYDGDHVWVANGGNDTVTQLTP